MHGRVIELLNFGQLVSDDEDYCITDYDLDKLNDEQEKKGEPLYFDYVRDLTFDIDEYNSDLNGFLDYLEENEFATVHRTVLPEGNGIIEADNRDRFSVSKEQRDKLIKIYDQDDRFGWPEVFVTYRENDYTLKYMSILNWYKNELILDNLYYPEAIFDVHI